MKRYEFLEHTADIAVRAYGGSLKELFASAAMAMTGILVTKKGNFPKHDLQDVLIRKEEESLEILLKAWLDELLFYYATRHLVLYRIKRFDYRENAFEANVLLDSFDPAHYDVHEEIKAVTYHELKVERIRNRWQATIIFDV